MAVEHRLRKFETTELDGEPVPRMLWVKWFKTADKAREFAALDSATEVVWIGMAALSEEHTYDIKRVELII